MIGVGESLFAAVYAPFRRLVLNLVGQNEDAAVLTGAAMEEEGYLEEWTLTKNCFAVRSFHLCKMILAYYFGEYEEAAKHSRAQGSRDHASFVLLPIRFLFQGLIELSRAKTRGPCRHRRRARKYVRIFEGWVKRGAVNCHHMLRILGAELLPSQAMSDAREVQDAFDEAIAASLKLGFLHHSALSNERAGLYFASIDDNLWAATSLQRAYALYDEWGAVAKVKQMERVHSSRLSESALHTPNRSRTEVSSRSRGFLTSRARPQDPYTATLIIVANQGF